MKMHPLCFATLFIGGFLAQSAGAEWIPTNHGDGADAEVRESNPTQNRGDSTELATRVRNDFISGDTNDGSDRNSAIYTKFDLTGAANPASIETAFSLTYRNNNLTGNRIQDQITPNPAIRAGLAIYGLDPNLDWAEDTITYLNAPGLDVDGDIGTVDVNSDLVFLGTVEFPAIGTQNHLPIGGTLRFCSDNLDVFIKGALDNDFDAVTLVTMRIHGGDSPFDDWRNFQYLFNPKEQTTLNDDNYNPDGLGSIGNLTSQDNSAGLFSPSIDIVDKSALVHDDLCAIGVGNEAPDCSAAFPSVADLWPANGEFVPVNIDGITDGDDDPITVTIDSIFQDEPTGGGGNLLPDGSGIGSDTAYLRAERSPQGNGRVYTVAFTADDGNGGQCSDTVTVGVRKGNGPAVDDGPVYDSTLP